MMRLIPFLAVLAVAGCDVAVPQSPPAPPSPPSRPMDEVPVQAVLATGDREYRFANGCIVALEPAQAVLRSETADCELYHRDIALLYASGD